MYKILKIKNRQHGFTIIELMIATTVFSVILLLATNGVIQIGRLYYKGITTSRTQEAARSVAEEVSRNFQLSKAGDSYTSRENLDDPAIVVRSVCFGINRFTYIIDYQINKNEGRKHALWYDNVQENSCPGADPAKAMSVAQFNQDNPSNGTEGSNGKELLSNNMRLLRFDINSAGSTTNITVRVAYGDNDLLDIYENNARDRTPVPIENGQCKLSIAGSSFCAVSELDTVVQRRL